MAQSLVKTFVTFGLDGHEITIEADTNKALPTIEIIGLPDAAIKESKERLRATFRNLNIELPPRKIILNLAPSDIKKVGTQFDLPMAVAILFLTTEHLFHKDILEQTVFFGELGLDGSVRRTNGLLPALIAATKKGYKVFFVPKENVHELEFVQGIILYPVESFSEIVNHFIRGNHIIASKGDKSLSLQPENYVYSGVDYGSVRGHLVAKRALSIAAAGGHNVLLAGSPGSGKTLLTQALPSIMPPLHFDEMMEVSQIYSLVGKLSQDVPIITQRPFRPVHHTASKVAIIGGGAQLLPGEVSLAHKGILFFDELPEFPREVLEVLRQPLEDRTITISRAAGSVSYPAHVMFVAAMNPCPCGYYKDREKVCSCGLGEVRRYQSKISGPLLDRIDMILEIPRESPDALFEKDESMNSASMKKSVIAARERQQKRYKGTHVSSNAGLTAKNIHHYVILDERAEELLKQASKNLCLSGRIVHRMMKLARTIADIEGSEIVELSHIAEAMHYRSKSMFVERN